MKLCQSVIVVVIIIMIFHSHHLIAVVIRMVVVVVVVVLRVMFKMVISMILLVLPLGCVLGSAIMVASWNDIVAIVMVGCLPCTMVVLIVVPVSSAASTTNSTPHIQFTNGAFCHILRSYTNSKRGPTKNH